MKKDEKLLKKLLHEEVDQKFDKNFWEKMEKETDYFDKKKSPYFIPAMGIAMAACLAIVFVMNNKEANTVNVQALAAYENRELLEEMDLLEDIDEKMMDLNDEDWETLLAQN